MMALGIGFLALVYSLGLGWTQWWLGTFHEWDEDEDATIWSWVLAALWPVTWVVLTAGTTVAHLSFAASRPAAWFRNWLKAPPKMKLPKARVVK